MKRVREVTGMGTCTTVGDWFHYKDERGKPGIMICSWASANQREVDVEPWEPPSWWPRISLAIGFAATIIPILWMCLK